MISRGGKPPSHPVPDELEHRRKATRAAAADMAREELGPVLSGDLARSVQEIRAHLAFAETQMPASAQMAFLREFGGLLSADPPGADPGGR